MRKYFLSKFTYYSLLSAISQFSLSLLCVGIICWFVLFFVRICVLFFICDFFDFGWEDLDFLFGSILPWNVIFLFSSFPLTSVSFPTFYNRITLLFRLFGSRWSVWRSTFLVSFIRILPYHIVRYVCYVWVLFFDFMYVL